MRYICILLICLFKHTRQKKQACVIQIRARMGLHVIYSSQQMVTPKTVIPVNPVQAGILGLIVKSHHVSKGPTILTFMCLYLL